MYGLVNKAIKDMILERYGETIWDQTLEESGLDIDCFISMNQYNDSYTYALVAAASKTLKMPGNDFLEDLGHYWSTVTGPKSYKTLMDLTGKDLISFLSNLNTLHERITSTFVGYTPPYFKVFPDEDGFIVRYQSKREGLLHFVIGLIQGLADSFAQKIKIAEVNQCASKSGETWLIKVLIANNNQQSFRPS